MIGSQAKLDKHQLMSSLISTVHFSEWVFKKLTLSYMHTEAAKEI